MAQVLASIAVDAAPGRVFAFIRDLDVRARILPDGWSFGCFVSDYHQGIGAAIELQASIGPQPTTHVIQVQTLVEDEGRLQLIESPPTADNYITTWTVRDSDGGCVVFLHTEFSYGGFIGEFFARRRLRKAYQQMLARLKALAELGSTGGER